MPNRPEPLGALRYRDSELVFGVVSPVGADLDHFESVLRDLLQNFQYKLNAVRLSSFLDRLPSSVFKKPLRQGPEFDRIRSHMDAGNDVRTRARNGEILALYAASAIREARVQASSSVKPRTKGKAQTATPLTSTVHFLRSLKHPAEVQALRRIYGPGFFLIGLHVPESKRVDYLTTRKGLTAQEAQALIERDEDERDTFGQRTRDTFQLSDVFIRNDVELVEQVERFVNLVFSHPHITPSRDEHAMFLAYAASLRSADLSRQVGAVVVSAGGETIATGANDVPRFGGGQYWAGDGDQRDHKKGYDSNAKEIEAIVLDTIDRVTAGTKRPQLRKDLSRRLAGGRLYDLTEFGRAVHAEMEALTCCARVGVSPCGGTLYTTTFPCHNCAKHIVGAGIRRVVFVEPYPKSHALKLHSDSIELEPIGVPVEQTKVCFSPFVGIAARRYFDLFSMKLSTGGEVRRKLKGEAVVWRPATAEPRIFMSPASYLDRERLAVLELFKTQSDTLGATR